MAARTLLASGPLWLVAGFTWWPAFILFPVAGVAAVAMVRPLLPQVSANKVLEEMAWTDHAAAMEEGVAARDDLRTSLGQPYLMRHNSRLTAAIHAKFAAVTALEATISRRTGTLLHARPRRDRRDRSRPRLRRQPVHRVAGDAVHRHHDVRRPGRPAGPPPARPPGRLGAVIRLRGLMASTR